MQPQTTFGKDKSAAEPRAEADRKGLNECGVEQLLLLLLLRLEEKEEKEKEEEEEAPDLLMLEEQQNPLQTEPELTSSSD